MELQYYILCKKMYENNIHYMEEIVQNYQCIKIESYNTDYELQKDNQLLYHSKEQIFFMEKNIQQMKEMKQYCETKINELCNHEIVHDTIDIHIDKSQNIQYCKICEMTII